MPCSLHISLDIPVLTHIHKQDHVIDKKFFGQLPSYLGTNGQIYLTVNALNQLCQQCLLSYGQEGGAAGGKRGLLTGQSSQVGPPKKLSLSQVHTPQRQVPLPLHISCQVTTRTPVSDQTYSTLGSLDQQWCHVFVFLK